MGLFQPNRGSAPWPEVHHSCCKGMSVGVRPGLHLVKSTKHSMDCSQIVAAYNARQPELPGGAISHFSLFRIRILLRKNGSGKVRRFYFCRHFFILYFSNDLNVFSLIVISIMTLCIHKLS